MGKFNLTHCLATSLLMVGAMAATAAVPHFVSMAPQRIAAHSQKAPQRGEDKRWETILEENFSKMTKGTEDEPDATMYPETYFEDYGYELPSDIFEVPGQWLGLGVYQAGGNCALNYPGMGGMLNTPSMDMTGRLKITIRVKALGEKTTMFAVNLLTGSLDEPVDATGKTTGGAIRNITSADGWQVIEETLDNPTTTPCWLQFNAMMYNAKGVVIDYIKIERDLEFLTPPTNLRAQLFTADGFTASWSSVPKANNYLLTLFEKQPIDDGDYQAFNEFEEVDPVMGEPVLAEGWTGKFGFSFDGNIITTEDADDDVFEGKSSLRMHRNDKLSLFLNNTLIKNVSFAVLAHTNEGSQAVLRVTPYTINNPGENDYEFYWMIRPEKLANGWNWVDMMERYPDDFMGGYTRFDIDAEGLAEGEYFMIDNLCGITEARTQNVAVMEDMKVSEASYAFTGLKAESNYAFTVKAQNDASTSAAAEECLAIGVAAPKVLEASELDRRGAFTANWTQPNRATGYKLQCYEVSTVEEDVPEFVVLDETFSKAKGAEDGSFISLDNMDYVELDLFADNKGWGGSGTLIGDQMVGCNSIEAFGQSIPFDMLSPRMDLSHDNGNMNVFVEFIIQNADDVLVVQLDESEYIALQPSKPMNLEGGTVPFTKGTGNSRFMLYTMNGSPFMINQFKVTQDIPAGEKMRTLVYEDVIDDAATTSQRISGLERKDNIQYAYCVTSRMQRYGKVYMSEPSDDMMVDLYGNSGVNSITAGSALTPVYYNLSGQRLNEMPTEGGVYIKVVDGNATKCVIR